LEGTRGSKDKSQATVATEGTSEHTASPPGTDLELLRAAAGGDRGAFHRLVDRHSDGLFRLAVTLSRSRADAEDVLQETLIGAYRGLGRFDGRASVKTWLTQILVRQSAKMWHKGKRMSQAVRIDSPGGAAMGESLAERSSQEDADRRMDLMAVIRTLPDDHREVILLREVQGLSYDEIARALGVPRGTVESRLHRARAGLRQRLKGYPP
jgi:RNA polymerase sigma-70 factor (ECF subfamily)